ncbi:MAG: hypothetical protein ABW066_07075 [Sedimenticola sp.]
MSSSASSAKAEGMLNQMMAANRAMMAVILTGSMADSSLWVVSI